MVALRLLISYNDEINLKILENHALPDPVNSNPYLDYDPETVEGPYFNATAPDIPHRPEFCTLQRFQFLPNSGFLPSPISNSSTQLQIAHFIYTASSTFGKGIEFGGWSNLPRKGKAVESVLFLQPSHFYFCSLLISLFMSHCDVKFKLVRMGYIPTN